MKGGITYIETQDGSLINAAYIAGLSARETRPHDPEGSGRLIATMANGLTVRIGQFSSVETARIALRRLAYQAAVEGGGVVNFVGYDADYRGVR